MSLSTYFILDILVDFWYLRLYNVDIR